MFVENIQLWKFKEKFMKFFMCSVFEVDLKNRQTKISPEREIKWCYSLLRWRKVFPNHLRRIEAYPILPDFLKFLAIKPWGTSEAVICLELFGSSCFNVLRNGKSLSKSCQAFCGDLQKWFFFSFFMFIFSQIFLLFFQPRKNIKF